MELQHVNVKLILAHPEEIGLEPLIPVFHSWIQEQGGGELLLDVADYRHVHAGPGIVLIGHEADYSVDNTGNRFGVRYNRKTVLDGSNQDRFAQAMRAALTACQRLEAEPRLSGKLRFNGCEVELFVNDRLLAPNSDATREATMADLQAFSARLFRGGKYSLSFDKDPRKLFGASVKALQQFATGDLLANLNS